MDCLVFFRRWRSWIRPLVIAVYIVVLVVAVPLLIVALNINGAKTHTQGWLVGGIFVALAIPISVWGILQHLIHYTQPFLQRHIIRILWMVPVYAMDAWLALRFKEAAIYLDTLRECYEAYVVYNFMAYLLAFLTSRYPDLDGEIAAKPQVKHIIPFCCLPPWQMGRELIQYCKHGVLQYTVVRPLTTSIALICQMTGVYDEGDFNFKSAWSYLVIINNISQIWAMYCLVLFYLATKEQLAHLKPVSKFMCIKAVVFMTFWQSVIIAALVKLGVIRQDNLHIYSVEDVATGLQDFIICIEMFLAAIAHYFSFSHKPYVDTDTAQGDCFQSFMDMWDVSDVRADVVEHVRHVGKTVTRTLRRGQSGETERTPLLNDGSSDRGNYSERSLSDMADVQIGVDPSMTDGDRHITQRGSISTMDSMEASLADTLSRRSFNASMNNYLEFSDSVEVHAPADPDATSPKQVMEGSNLPRQTSQNTDLLGREIPHEEVQNVASVDILKPQILSDTAPEIKKEGNTKVPQEVPTQLTGETVPPQGMLAHTSGVSEEDGPSLQGDGAEAATSSETRNVKDPENKNLEYADVSTDDPFKRGNPVYEAKNEDKGDNVC